MAETLETCVGDFDFEMELEEYEVSEALKELFNFVVDGQGTIEGVPVAISGINFEYGEFPHAAPKEETVAAVVEKRLETISSGNTEIRVVDPDTGAEKGSKSVRMDLVPVAPLWELARHYGRGAEKYEDRNWEKGYDWSLSYAALTRHLLAFWNGEDIDEESGSKHIIAVAWHAFALAQFMETHPEKDNRPPRVGDNSL